MYIKRHIGEAFLQRSKERGAIVVTGARQVGKSTLIEHYFANLPKLVFDNKMLMAQAKEEPSSFFEYNPPPIFLDEAQYVPELFPYIKMNLDESKKKTQFFLSGSQRYELMENVSESLAGRAGILELTGLSFREIQDIDFYKEFLPTKEYLLERKKYKKGLELSDVWKLIHRGSYPELHEKPDYDWSAFYADYVKTYIERDVRKLAQVGDELQFMKFMSVMAAMTGQLLNLSSVARDVGISQPTANRWLSILNAGGILHLLQPFSNNAIKRSVKTPKVYFWDTGLAAYLTRWNTPETLQNGNMSGHFFETFVVAEILKTYKNRGLDPAVYFWRDSKKREIDLLIFENGVLYPIEIKQTADPRQGMINNFDVLNDLQDIKRGEGGLICLADELLPLKGNDKIIPLWAV